MTVLNPLRARSPYRSLAGAMAMLLAAAALLCPAARAQAPGGGRYAAFEYGVIESGASAVVRRVNAQGELAAGLQGIHPRRQSTAVLLTRRGPIDITAAQDTDFGTAYGVNDQGEVAGAFNSGEAVRPFRSVRDRAFRPLPLPPGDTAGVAYAMSTSGEAVGHSSGPTGSRAVWWSRAGVVQVLPGPGGTSSRALGVNEHGDVVGVMGAGPSRAVLWPRKGPALDLGTLPGFAGGEAVAINERGQIVGQAVGAGNLPDRTRAVLWMRGQAPRDLGTLPGGEESRARDISVRGEVVGMSASTQGQRAFLWTAATGMVDLNALAGLPGLVLTDALAINRNGEIVVVGHDVDPAAPPDPHDHADHEAPRRILLLTPRP